MNYRFLTSHSRGDKTVSPREREHSFPSSILQFGAQKAVMRSHHPYQGIFHVPNPTRNGERSCSCTDSDEDIITRRHAHSPPTNLCQSQSTASPGRRER